MQKSGINFFNIVPRTIVPLDSACVFALYAVYFSVFCDFLQCVFVSWVLGWLWFIFSLLFWSYLLMCRC